MKKIIFSVLAIAAIAACTKSEVQYESPAEIGFAPAIGNVTKIAGLSGPMTDGKLGIWAYWDKTATVTDTGTAEYSGTTTYNDNYLINALFTKGTTYWGGGYPWPVNGALIFAGYTTPRDTQLPLYDSQSPNTESVAYDLANDKLTFYNYDNSTEFDLCWFGKTPKAYNHHKNASGSVPVTLNHALSWVSIAVYGDATTASKWKIESLVLKNAVTKGTGVCTNALATWESITTGDITISSTPVSNITFPYTLTQGTINNNETTGVKLTDNLIIPSLPLELTINYSFPVGNVTKTDSKTVSLKLNDGNTDKWTSGKHYTYTLVFKANEILVAPSYGDWTPGTTPGITVE